MRRALIVLVSLAAWPMAASAQPGQAPELTLTAPKATTYLHRVDFVGRLSPAAQDARVRLLRGSRLIAYARVRDNGFFKIPVELASPGPFHVAWLTATSNEVRVRIRPRLDVKLVGTQVAGAPLRLEAAVTPAAAGPIRVRVANLDRRVSSVASVDLPTRQIGALQIKVTTEPPSGYDKLHRELTATLRAPNLSLGTTSQTAGGEVFGAKRYRAVMTTSSSSLGAIHANGRSGGWTEGSTASVGLATAWRAAASSHASWSTWPVAACTSASGPSFVQLDWIA